MKEGDEGSLTHMLAEFLQKFSDALMMGEGNELLFSWLSLLAVLVPIIYALTLATPPLALMLLVLLSAILIVGVALWSLVRKATQRTDSTTVKVTKPDAEVDEHEVPEELKEKLKRICKEHGVQNPLFLRSPEDNKAIELFGEGAESIPEKKLSHLLKGPWSKYKVIRMEPGDGDYVEQHVLSPSVVKYTKTDNRSTSELVVKAKLRTNGARAEAAFAVTAAHMMFSPQTNRQLQQNNQQAEQIRKILATEFPENVYNVQFGSENNVAVPVDGDTPEYLMPANHPPLFGYRYRLEQNTGGRPDSPGRRPASSGTETIQPTDTAEDVSCKFFMNDVALFHLQRDDASHLNGALENRSRCWVEMRDVNVVKSYLKADPPRKVLVKQFSGSLYMNKFRYQEQRDNGQPHHILFTLDSGKLDMGDSGIIVYEKKPNQDPGETEFVPLGLYIGKPARKWRYRDGVYLAVILHKAFEDIAETYPQRLEDIVPFS